MRLIRRLLIALSLLMAFNAHGAVINGILVDANDTLPLMQATVRLLRPTADSTLVKGLTTDLNGVFTIKGVKEGKYLLKFSYIGYDDLITHISVGHDGRDVNMGVVKLNPAGYALKEVSVVGIKTPITVKEDTIEYNADTYKLQANAVVEDLIKRLPGVEVGSDGKITANGKQVKKILIDGKEFFGDDPTVASKNIPADMVNKLQVIDRKSDLARLTGVDDGEDETVINLTVKKGMNNGWFGTVNAGYGTDERYAGNVIANYFHNGNQFTIMGGGNNTNNLGFTDGGASRFRRFGGDNGVTTSKNFGVNFNVGSTDDDHLRVGGNVMYSHSDRDTRSATARQYLLSNDSSSYYRASSASRDKSHNISGDFRLKWEIDSLSTFEFRPNFSFNFSNSVKSDSSMTRAGDINLTPVNRSLSYYDNDGKSYEFGGSIVFNHKFRYHPGRSYSVNLRYNYSDVDEDGNTYTRNTYYLKEDPEETIDQVYDNRRTTNGFGGRLTWTEPLGDVKNARFLTLAYRANYRFSKANKSVYDITRDNLDLAPVLARRNAAAALLDPALLQQIADDYSVDVFKDALVLGQIFEFELGPELARDFNANLSNNFRNKYFDQSFEVGFRQVRKKYNLNLGVSLNSAMSSSEDLINSARNIPSRWVWTPAPFVRLNYKFSNSRKLRLFYRMRTTQPSLTQLQPVADESNPLSIVVGNPELKPTFTHGLNMRYSDFDQDSQRSIMGMMGVNVSQNSIISTTTFDAITGGRTTTYDNVNGVWDAMGMGMVSFPLRNKSFYFTANLFQRLAQTIGYNNGEYNRSLTWNVNVMPGMAFRNSEFDLEIRPRYSFQTTHNSMNTVTSRDIHTYGGMFNGTYSAPFGLVISTDLNYSKSTGYTSGYNTSQWLWNASVAYQFLASKAASVQLSVYDILGQRKSVNRNVTANYIEDLAYNSLTRYGMITFTYRFSSFKKGDEPKVDYGGFGPDGPPGERGGRRGGQRPSGPPPGGPPPGFSGPPR